MRRVPGRTLLVVGAAVLACTGCADPATPSAPRIDTAQLAAEVESLWTPAGAGAGAYAATDNLHAEPALYATAWSLRLARAVHQMPSRLSAAATAAWLARRLAAPESAGDPPDSLPPLYRAWLAARALADLGQPPSPATVTAALSPFGPSDGMYRIDPRQAPAWGATRLAVETLRLARLEVPADTVRAVSADLGASLRSGAPNLDVDELTPVWSLADDLLPAAARAPFRTALEGRIGETARRLVANPTSGETLDVAVDLAAIAAANSLPAPALDLQALVAPLQKATGYLSLNAGDGGLPGAGDPQVTYYGVALGMPVSPTLRETLMTRLLPSGWRVDAGQIDPVASYYCEAILESLGIDRHRGAMAAQATSWLGAVGSDTPENAATDERTYFALALARLTGARVPASLPAVLTQRLQRSGAHGNLGSIWLLGLVGKLGLPLPEAVAARLSSAVDRPTATLQDLDLHLLVQDLLSRPHTVPADDWWSKLRIGDGYRATADAQETDLPATAFAARALGLSPSDRERLLSDFVSQGRVFYAPTSLTEAAGNNAPPQAAYLGLYLLGTLHDDSGVHL